MNKTVHTTTLTKTLLAALALVSCSNCMASEAGSSSDPRVGQPPAGFVLVGDIGSHAGGARTGAGSVADLNAQGLGIEGADQLRQGVTWGQRWETLKGVTSTGFNLAATGARFTAKAAQIGLVGTLGAGALWGGYLAACHPFIALPVAALAIAKLAPIRRLAGKAFKLCVPGWSHGFFEGVADCFGDSGRPGGIAAAAAAAAQGRSSAADAALRQHAQQLAQQLRDQEEYVHQLEAGVIGLVKVADSQGVNVRPLLERIGIKFAA